jgi:hypothetical protein
MIGTLALMLAALRTCTPSARRRWAQADDERIAAALVETVYVGRHRYGTAKGTCAQQAHWDTPTGQFEALVATTWTTGERRLLTAVAA